MGGLAIHSCGSWKQHFNAGDRDPDEVFGWIDRLRGPEFPMILQIPFNQDPKIVNRTYTALRKKLDALVKCDW